MLTKARNSLSIAAGALALGLGGASATAFAGPTAPVGVVVITEAPPPARLVVVSATPVQRIESTRIVVGSTEPSPETATAARHEAAAAMAEARRNCRSEHSRQGREDCLAAARDDYRSLMSTARNGAS